MAATLHVSVNDNVSLELPRLTKIVDTAPLRAHFDMVNISFRVSGIIDEFNGLVAYVGLDHLKDVSNFPGTPANTILIKLNNPTQTNLDRIRDTIELRYNYNVRNIYTRAEQTSDLLVLLNALYWVLYVVAVFAVLLAVAMVYNTVYINLQEQQREIATLLTIGTQNRKLIRKRKNTFGLSSLLLTPKSDVIFSTLNSIKMKRGSINVKRSKRIPVFRDISI